MPNRSRFVLLSEKKKGGRYWNVYVFVYINRTRTDRARGWAEADRSDVAYMNALRVLFVAGCEPARQHSRERCR